MKLLYSMLFATAVSTAASAQVGYTMLNYTIVPTDGETVTSLNEIAITFPDPVDGIDVNIMSSNIGNYATLTCGDKVIRATGINAGIRDIQTAYITFPETTDPGTYVFNLDQDVLKDYDQSETAEEGDGYSVNPPIKATYTIKGSSVPETSMSVYTIDPADGAVLTGIHSITIEFPNTSDGIDEYVSNPVAYLYKGDEKVAETTNLEMLDDYTSVQVTFDTTIKEPGEYTFVLPAETYKDFNTYGDDVVANPEIRATYTVKKDDTPTPGSSMSVYEISPESGSVLNEIHLFTIIFPNTKDGIESYTGDARAKLLKDGELVVETKDVYLNSDYTGAKIFFFPSITEPGEYTLVIPADTFYDYTTEGDSVVTNPEITATYTVVNTTGVDNIAVDSADKTVYDLFGRKLDNAAKLPAGIYIVNGKKTIVR